jgi:hypothetical protein
VDSDAVPDLKYDPLARFFVIFMHNVNVKGF